MQPEREKTALTAEERGIWNEVVYSNAIMDLSIGLSKAMAQVTRPQGIYVIDGFQRRARQVWRTAGLHVVYGDYLCIWFSRVCLLPDFYFRVRVGCPQYLAGGIPGQNGVVYISGGYRHDGHSVDRDVIARHFHESFSSSGHGQPQPQAHSVSELICAVSP